MVIEFVVLHTTDMAWGDVDTYRRMHIHERGWQDIGYHYLITNAFPTYESLHGRRPDYQQDGKVHLGRDLDRDGDVEEHIGAHAVGYNHNSIGVALVGTNGAFTGLQMHAAFGLCRDLMHRHEVPVRNVIGHYETGARKTCPDLDMDWFRGMLRASEMPPIA